VIAHIKESISEYDLEIEPLMVQKYYLVGKLKALLAQEGK